ncbi:MAG: hypothetical protein ACREDG_04295 [Methylocella sp.]
MLTATEARTFSRDLAHAIVADTDASKALQELALRDPTGQLLARAMISDIRLAVAGARGARLFPRVIKVALRHLSPERLPTVGLSQFDWGGLVAGLITGAAAYSAAKIQAKTQTTIAKIQMATQAAQDQAALQAQELAAQAAGAPPARTPSSPPMGTYTPPAPGLPGWLLPVGLVAAAGIGYFAFIKPQMEAKRKRR